MFPYNLIIHGSLVSPKAIASNSATVSSGTSKLNTCAKKIKLINTSENFMCIVHDEKLQTDF